LNFAFETWKKRALKTLEELRERVRGNVSKEAEEDLEKLASWIPRLPLRDLRVFVEIVEELSAKHKIEELKAVLPTSDEYDRIKSEEYERMLSRIGD